MSEEYITIDAARLENYAFEMLVGAGVPMDRAALVARSLVEANLRGVDSHGVQLLNFYIEHMKHFLAPWVDPAALIHVSGAILDDLIRQASEFECLLRGLDPVQVERRKKLNRRVVTVGMVLGVVVLFVMLSGGPEGMLESANSTQTQYVELVNGITPRVKIGLSALVVLAIGAVSLRSMCRD